MGYGRKKKTEDNMTNKHKKGVPEIVLKVIKEADILLEILDARFVNETRNKEIESEIIKRRKKLVFILNKVDLVNIDELYKKIELDALKPYVLFSCSERKGLKDLRILLKIEAKKINFPQIRVGVIGYPNTGKSSIINLLMGKHVARTSQQAGFTKGMQKLKLSSNIMLLDTPGLIPPAEDSHLNMGVVAKHAQIGIDTWDKIRDPDLAVYNMMNLYPKIFQRFYNIKEDANVNDIIEKVGREKNLLKKGGEVDIDRASRIILKDFQEGKIKVL